MNKVKEIDNEKGTYLFYCPGCECHHAYYTVKDGDKPVWSFNGLLDNPTFSPSLLNTYPSGNKCHLFVTNGQIEYCQDSFHHLKGRTVQMTEA